MGEVVAFQPRSERGEVLEPWVRAPAIVEHFGVSLRTVERWTSEGLIPSRKVRGVRQYQIGAVERALNE